MYGDCLAVAATQAVVTKMPTNRKGPRFHVIELDPWPGGPSEAVTWSVLRKNLSLCPFHVAPPDERSGSEDIAQEPEAVAVAASAPTQAPTTGVTATVISAASQHDNREEKEAEREEGSGDKDNGEVLLPLASSVQVYPAGTVVVVRSVETDPGRTLKFARSETYEAAFQELLGRQVGWFLRSLNSTFVGRSSGR